MKKKFVITLSDLRKALGLTLVIAVAVSSVFLFAEPSVTNASATQSATVVVTLFVNTGISITQPGNTAMSTSLGVSSNSAVATSTFTVATNNNIGYTLTVNATSTPAMFSISSSTQSIPDAGASVATWSVPANSYQFGFSAYSSSGPTDVPTGTWGTPSGTGCQTGTSTPSTSLKYRGFNGATPITIATNGATTTTSGDATTVCYAVGQNGSYIPSGTFQATVVATATTN